MWSQKKVALALLFAACAITAMRRMQQKRQSVLRATMYRMRDVGRAQHDQLSRAEDRVLELQDELTRHRETVDIARLRAVLDKVQTEYVELGQQLGRKLHADTRELLYYRSQDPMLWARWDDAEERWTAAAQDVLNYTNKEERLVDMIGSFEREITRRHDARVAGTQGVQGHRVQSNLFGAS